MQLITEGKTSCSKPGRRLSGMREQKREMLMEVREKRMGPCPLGGRPWKPLVSPTGATSVLGQAAPACAGSGASGGWDTVRTGDFGDPGSDGEERY